MRLTLRTLLAYLDDMLEDDDANALKAKIDESGIATSLIARIRSSVDKREIGAISPDAIGPLENANVMSEYLDSTLSPEQIAEIERLCLESDTSLSEAAACHQILTVVLGQPAQVSDGLRQRIYKLPNSAELRAMEQQSPPAADTHSAKPAATAKPITYSGIEIPPKPGKDANDSHPSNYALANASAADLDRDAAGFDRDAATAIRPVEPKDSGVAKASARLRNNANPDDDSGRSEAEIVAGTTRALMGRTEGYGGGIRPSRITPWLVALALAGVLLYALGQVFSPLTESGINDAIAQRENEKIMAPTNAPDSEKGDPETLGPQSGETVQNAITDTASADSPEQAAGVTSKTDSEADANETTIASEADASEMADDEPEIDEVVADDAAKTSAELETPDSGSVEPTVAQPNAPGAAGAELSATQPGAAELSATPPDDAEPAVANPVDTAMTEAERVDFESVDAAEMVEADLLPDAAADDLDTEATLESPMTTDDVPADALTPGESIPGEPTPSATPSGVAELTQAGALVIVRQDDAWKRLAVRIPESDPAAEVPPSETATEPNVEPGSEAVPAEETWTVASVAAGQTIVAPALFRPTLANPSGIEWTLAGPTRMRIGQNDAKGVITQILDGRILLASTEPDVKTLLVLGKRQIKIAMPEAQTVLAIELSHFRPLGVNPLVPANRVPTYRVISVQGDALIQVVPMPGDAEPTTSETLTLEPNHRFDGEGIQPARITPVDRLPTWIDAAAKRDVLADSARDGLMEFATRDEAIEKSLREAMTFRRVEVAALAAETLLLLGRADVYFGGDGILHRPRQRLYWKEHVDMLRQQVASSAEAAEAVRVAIERAELADSKRLFQLLVGFTPEELEAGADAELVAMLDSSSMAVRVLAIENLREIVGETLGYRADQENANARKSDIKKWETRLRRGDIRYPPQ